MTSYLRSIVTMGLSPTVSEINGCFSRKSLFSHPRVFCAAHPLNWVSALGSKKTRMMGLYRAEKEVWQYLQPCGVDTIHQRDGQTDGHRTTAKTALTHSVARNKHYFSKDKKVTFLCFATLWQMHSILETKASSPAGQCIPAGYCHAHMLLYESGVIITM